MVNLFKRMRKLQTKLLNIRTGPGAALLPTPQTATKEFPAITRLHLTYARKIYNGHQGARHFWRTCLPRLKYHNPSVGISVKQTDEQDGPAALTIYFSGAAAPGSAVAAAAGPAVEDKYAPALETLKKGTEAEAEESGKVVVDVKGLDYKEIWNKVMVVTGAKEVAATAEEVEQLRKLEAMKVQGEKDRARVAGIRQAKKDQERMLAEARGEVEKLKQM